MPEPATSRKMLVGRGSLGEMITGEQSKLTLPWTTGQPLGRFVHSVANVEWSSIIISCHFPAIPGCKGIRETQIEERKMDSHSFKPLGFAEPQFSWNIVWSPKLLSHPRVSSRASSAHETEDTHVKRSQLQSNVSPSSR